VLYYLTPRGNLYFWIVRICGLYFGCLVILVTLPSWSFQTYFTWVVLILELDVSIWEILILSIFPKHIGVFGLAGYDTGLPFVRCLVVPDKVVSMKLCYRSFV
jgi:hypothetical protein